MPPTEKLLEVRYVCRIVEIVGTAGGAELLALHLGEELAEREARGLREAVDVVFLGAASKSNAHAAAKLGHAVFGEG